MQAFIFYRNQSRPSAKALHLSLKKATSTDDTVFIRGSQNSKYLANREYDHIINMGNSEDIPYLGNPTIVNPPKTIKLGANKRLARIRFKAKQISAPTLWLTFEDIPKNEFPVVGRTSYHMKASGFWFCKSKEEARKAQQSGATHFMKFIKDTREFRVHVFSTTLKPQCIDDYIVGKLSEKVPTEDVSGTIIKNHDHGYHFLGPTDRDQVVLNRVRNLAKEVLCKFGMHFGGVDIIYSLLRQKAYVLEINSTPCLTDTVSNTIDIYTTKICGLLNIPMKKIEDA